MTRYDQCHYCSTRYKNQGKNKDFRSIKNHINQIHSNLVGTQALDEGGTDQLLHDSEGYENEAVVEEPLLNHGVETEMIIWDITMMRMMHWLRTYSKCLKLKVKPHKITSMIQVEY